MKTADKFARRVCAEPTLMSLLTKFFDALCTADEPEEEKLIQESCGPLGVLSWNHVARKPEQGTRGILRFSRNGETSAETGKLGIQFRISEKLGLHGSDHTLPIFFSD